MSGFTGASSNPIFLRYDYTTHPFAGSTFSDTAGYIESISVTLSVDPDATDYYGPEFGSLMDPLGTGSFDAATNTFTDTATVSGSLTPATQILDRLIYTPPEIPNGDGPLITATVSVTSTDPATGQSVTAPPLSQGIYIVTPPAIILDNSDTTAVAGQAFIPFQTVEVFDQGMFLYSSSLDETIKITDKGIATDADGLLTGPNLIKVGAGAYSLIGYDCLYLPNLVFTTIGGVGVHAAVLTIAATDTQYGYTTTNSSTTIAINGTLPPGIITLGPGDQVYTATAGQAVVAGSGNDTVIANAGVVTVTGGAGKLTFFGGTGSSSVFGGTGSTLIFGGAGGGHFVGGAGGGNILVSQGAAGGNTTLTGAAAGDQIFGSAAGNDVLIAGAGRESVLGGGGPTSIQGGSAADVIFTGSGSTHVYGGTGAGDTVVGGSGALTVTANAGDAVFGNTGRLAVTGSSSDADSIVGGSGGLAVTGTSGNMLVVAGTGASTIATGNGASLIFEGTGASTVAGGAGSMEVVLGSGKASIADGAGPTSFEVVKGAAGGTDVLNGFKVGTDTISLFGYAGPDVRISTGSGNALISLADGTKIQVIGVTDLATSLIG